MKNVSTKTESFFSRVQGDARKDIVEQLGSEDDAQALFDVLTITHSSKSYHSLENELIERIQRFSNLDGYYRLFNAATKWAKFKESPEPDGWIRLHELQKVLSMTRPEPISQSFIIPDNYSLPNEEFHEQFVERISLCKQNLIVLTGAPGSGKSTYLSYLHKHLEEKKNSCNSTSLFSVS